MLDATLDGMLLSRVQLLLGLGLLGSLLPSLEERLVVLLGLDESILEEVGIL